MKKFRVKNVDSFEDSEVGVYAKDWKYMLSSPTINCAIVLIRLIR